MNVNQMLRLHASFCEECAKRISGVGAQQYYDAATGQQQFETMPLGELFEYAREELYDLANYAFMLLKRVDQLEEWVNGGQAQGVAGLAAAEQRPEGDSADRGQ